MGVPRKPSTPDPVNRCLYIPRALDLRMKKHHTVNWSMVGRNAFEATLDELEQEDRNGSTAQTPE